MFARFLQCEVLPRLGCGSWLLWARADMRTLKSTPQTVDREPSPTVLFGSPTIRHGSPRLAGSTPRSSDCSAPPAGHARISAQVGRPSGGGCRPLTCLARPCGGWRGLPARGGLLRPRSHGKVETSSTPHPRTLPPPPVTLLCCHCLPSSFCVLPFRSSAPIVALFFAFPPLGTRRWASLRPDPGLSRGMSELNPQKAITMGRWLSAARLVEQLCCRTCSARLPHTPSHAPCATTRRLVTQTWRRTRGGRTQRRLRGATSNTSRRRPTRCRRRRTRRPRALSQHLWLESPLARNLSRGSLKKAHLLRPRLTAPLATPLRRRFD